MNHDEPVGPEVEIRAMTADDAVKIASWRYEPPYDFYDLDADPEDYEEFFDSSRWGSALFAVHDDAQLVGFFSFEASAAAVAIGLGMRPDLTGRHGGEAFVRDGLAFALDLFSPRHIVLSVAEFNVRARRLYERIGFRQTRTFDQITNGGTFPFVEMILDC